MQKKTITHLTAIVNLEEHHTMDDLKPLVEFIEEELDTKVFQVAIHRDEGKLMHKESGRVLTSGHDFFANPADRKWYYDKSYTKPINPPQWHTHRNYHAHIEFVGLDSEGKSIKRNRLHKHQLMQITDKAAEVLNMKRTKSNRKRLSTRVFKEVKSHQNRVTTHIAERAQKLIQTYKNKAEIANKRVEGIMTDMCAVMEDRDQNRDQKEEERAKIVSLKVRNFKTPSNN